MNAGITLNQETADEVNAIALAERRSFSNTAALLIEEALRAREAAKQEAKR